MPRIILPAILGIVVSGCSTLEPESLGGLATVSALAIVLPFLPAAEAYHAISGDIERDRLQGEQLAEKLRPVYRERIALLAKRNPMADADRLAARGIIFIMPMDFPREHSFNMYPGMPVSWIKSIPSDQDEKAMEVIKSDQDAMYLMTISSDDPRHDVSVIYAFNQDPVYTRFFKERHAYKEAFNKRMAKKAKIADPKDRIDR